MDDDLGVAVGAEGVAQSLQLGHEVHEVVDFTVEDHHHAMVLIEQRLLSRREVDDRQTAMSQAHAGLGMQSPLIGAPMELGLIHASQNFAAEGGFSSRVKDSDQTAHQAVFRGRTQIDFWRGLLFIRFSLGSVNQDQGVYCHKSFR